MIDSLAFASMGRNRRKARVRAQKINSAKATHFTEAEEEFFRAGATQVEPAQVESFADLDEGYRRPGLLARLFSRWQPSEA
ncbi:MAG: hypothetical protein JWO36_174 [Myxococcales bacterium]|nr:hypothetical protein [Myxococcales bacterium]